MAKNQKFPNGIAWGKIWPKQRRRATFKFWPKIKCTHPVKYVEPNMARFCCLTCLKIEGNNLLKFGVEANFRLVSAYDPALEWT